jgi:TrmH family RNA methyltransferase
METITAVTNQRIRHMVQLAGRARVRREEGLFMIEGVRLFMDAPRDLLREVYVSEDLFEKASGDLRDRLLSCGAVLVTDQVMKKMADTRTPQGVVCAAAMPAYEEKDLLGDRPLLLILENIQDPGNLGTMFRTAEAAGATGILMSRDCADLFGPKTVRATMSSVFRVPFLVREDLPGTIRSLQERGIVCRAAYLEGSLDYGDLSYQEPCGLVIGNEGSGLTKETAMACRERVRIPMRGSIESLNAAMAAGILLYEADRQRRRG